jgi:XRE family transcriptional regulator, fatty acid utilization regulator
LNDTRLDPLVFGQRLRHLRRSRGLTLDALGSRVGKKASYLSLIENGHREVRLSLIEALAGALRVTPSDLVVPEAPTRRARLQIALQRAQEEPLYRQLHLPWLKPSASVPSDVIEHILKLFDELRGRSQVRAESPEAARRANSELRAEMGSRGNYFPEIEKAAAEALRAAGYDGSGAVAEGVLTDLTARLGFTLHRVPDLPPSARSVTDLVNRRIYIQQRNELRTRGARSVVLETLGHFVLGHADPANYGEFLRQRVEANYFAGAVLAPEKQVVELLAKARREGDISPEDVKQKFYVSYEMAAHRLTNLLTHHFDLRVHFLRSDEEGIIWKAYENDGVPFPADAEGVIEGQRGCRQWGARRAFQSDDKFADYSQYTETPAGQFWCLTYVEVDTHPHQAVTIGARAKDAGYFRGHKTAHRSTSGCPRDECCRRPPAELASRWQGKAWPSALAHSHVLAALPAGPFPGVDLYEVYHFLNHHSPEPIN